MLTALLFFGFLAIVYHITNLAKTAAKHPAETIRLASWIKGLLRR